MENLERILKKRILNFWPLSVSDFMMEANLNSKFGYYNKNIPFGKNKDFITSPETSQMFGELIGLWCIDCWNKMGTPKEFDIIELGPGSGLLIKDFIRVISINSEFLEKCRNIYLFEISPLLTKIQKKNLKNVDKKISKKIKWIKSLDEISNLPFILFANEFFDSLPIKQIQLTQMGWRERLVNFDEKKSDFYITYSNNPTILENFLPKVNNKEKIGIIYEIPFYMIGFLENLFNKIKKIKSACLIIDYAKNKKFGNSLKGIKKQKIVDPLKQIGNTDISSHINFKLIKKLSKKFNLNSQGPTSQKEFLIKIGILIRAEILIKNASSNQKKKLINGLNYLLDESKMGKIFNVISISNNKIKKLIGF